MTAMLPLMAVLERAASSSSASSTAASSQGLKVGDVRPPLRPLNNEEKRSLQTVVANLQAHDRADHVGDMKHERPPDRRRIRGHRRRPWRSAATPSSTASPGRRISGETFPTTNPATGSELARVAACGAADVDLAVRKAREAFEDGRWRSWAPAERKRVLIDFAQAASSTTGTNWRCSRASTAASPSPSARRSTSRRRSTPPLARRADRQDLRQHGPGRPRCRGLVVREPIGVVGCVLPWNFPLLMLAWKIGPALAAGCSVIVKPAEETSLTTLRLAELAFEAGVPAGVFNVVTGGGPEVGEPIGLHPDVDMVSFTGSTETGKRFLRYSADSNLKRSRARMRRQEPGRRVLDDAEDLDLVAEQVVLGAFWNMGENCSATSRLIVHEEVKDELLGA